MHAFLFCAHRRGRGWCNRQPGPVGALGWTRLLGWSTWASFNYWKPRAPVIPAIYIYIYIHTHTHGSTKMYLGENAPMCNNTPSTPPHKSTSSALLYARLPAPRRGYLLIVNLSLCFYSLITIAWCVVAPVATFVACWLQLWVSANCKLMIACCSAGCKHTWCVCPQGRQTFDTREEAYLFYLDYAKLAGFSVRTKRCNCNFWCVVIATPH
jgi:hypothetical protein